MDQNFQTSFIPKKPVINEPSVSSKPISLLTIISIFIFFTLVIGTGALYFYNSLLDKNLVKMENDLNLAKNRFEPSKIIQLQTLDRRLNASNEILNKHIASSPIFKELEKITLKTVGYTKFSLDFDKEKGSRVKIKMSGIGVGYRSVALQSDLFTKDKYFIDPVFSNLSLDDKGNVLFDLEFSVDSNLIDYKKMLETNNENLVDTPPVNEQTQN